MKRQKILVICLYFLLACSEKTSIEPPLSHGSIYGIVVNQETATPIIDAIVSATKNQVTDTTNINGNFILNGLSTDQEILQVSANGFEPQSKLVDIKKDSQWVEITLERVKENLYLYVGTNGGNNLYIVDVDSMQKEDSLYFSPGNMGNLFITPGGSKIYISQPWPDYSVYYLDTKSKSYYPTNLPYGSIYFNNQDAFLFSADGIFSLDTLTNQTQIMDTLTFIEFVAFDNSSSSFYFANYEAKLFQYDYLQKKIIDTLDIPPAWNKAMTADNRELYFSTPNGALGVINIQTGIVEYITNVNPNGQITITQDGKYVLITDPGSNFPMSLGSGLVTIIRTSDNSLEEYIDIKTLAGDNFSTSGIVITPSSNLAFTSNSNGGDIFLINIYQHKVLKKFEFRPIGATIGSLVIGFKPNL